MKAKIFFILLLLQTEISLSQWTEQTSGISATLYAVSAVDNNSVWICGSGGVVLLTTNGGQNWNTTSSPNTALSIYTIWGISRTSALLAGSGNDSYLYRTTNSGANWVQVFTEAGGFINAVAGSYTDSNHLVMYGDPVGGRWSLWQSFNGGVSWDSNYANLRIPQNGSEAGFINSLFMNYGYIWFGTLNERMYRIDNSGYTPQATTGLQHIYGIWFSNALTGMSGAASMMFTSNSGINWSPLPAPGSGLISGVTGIGNQWWFTKGTSVYYSSNNGTSWSASTTQSGFYYHITKARAPNNNNIWAIRQNGGISKLNYIVGIETLNITIPSSMELHQNYPNPFNPITKIRFSLPKPGFTRLVVYDAIGREITVLINEKLAAGEFEIFFNASGLPSGIYFYRIIVQGNAQKFSKTLKMLLVK